MYHKRLNRIDIGISTNIDIGISTRVPTQPNTKPANALRASFLAPPDSYFAQCARKSCRTQPQLAHAPIIMMMTMSLSLNSLNPRDFKRSKSWGVSVDGSVMLFSNNLRRTAYASHRKGSCIRSLLEGYRPDPYFPRLGPRTRLP